MQRIEPHAILRTIGEKVRTTEISPAEIVDACLTRIGELNPKLNAFITILADHTWEPAGFAASEIRQGRWRGPLHGIPVGVKDFYDTAGTRTTRAFKRFKDRVPAKDAAGVVKLKEAGAIIIGKTNMHTLGMGTTSMISHFGPVHNPWNSEYIAGGSSGGSAAAVASGMCYATLDTDAVGSCRLPAACCGVVGLKGTYGLISTQGILEGEEDVGLTGALLASGIITDRVFFLATSSLTRLRALQEQACSDHTVALPPAEKTEKNPNLELSRNRSLLRVSEGSEQPGAPSSSRLLRLCLLSASLPATRAHAVDSLPPTRSISRLSLAYMQV